MEKKWHIAYTRFREAENGDLCFSRPVVTDVPWWIGETDDGLPEDGAGGEEIELWRYARDFATREEAEAALLDFPIEEWRLMHGSFSRLRVFADGSRKWSRRLKPADPFDYYQMQVDHENEFGEYRAPPPSLMFPL